MELQKLSMGELEKLFLQVSDQYTQYLYLTFEEKASDPFYSELREELYNILLEYQKRSKLME